MAKAQLNWTPREKETYAVVSALRKWAGWIGIQPVLITTDHNSLEDWVHKKMDTPSGPAGRRARWHETLSKFDLQIQYIPGPENIVADAMSRFAYPAAKAFQDVSFHGILEAREQMKAIIEDELRDSKTIGLICFEQHTKPEIGPPLPNKFYIAGSMSRTKYAEIPPYRIRHITLEDDNSGSNMVQGSLQQTIEIPKWVDVENDLSEDSENEQQIEVIRFNPRKKSRKGKEPRPRGNPTTIATPSQNDKSIWEEDYAQSAWLGASWSAVKNNTADWPDYTQIHNGKLIQKGFLCVPENRMSEVLINLHIDLNHSGIQKTLREANRRYLFSPEIDLEKEISQVRQSCAICQACTPPRIANNIPIEFVHVPPHIFSNVAVDVFSLEPTEWDGRIFDAFLACIDRHSGWIIARPCKKAGLTTELGAKLILENGWETFGIPSVITSDQGPQFIGQWWRTMCARLGIRMAYSQAYRSQSNGRAERAGQSILSALRKNMAEGKHNWVEIFPRVIRQYHITPNEFGISPFQIVFGRERYEAASPYEISRECEGAIQFFDKQNRVDKEIADMLNQKHLVRQEQININRQASNPYKKGDWVWVLRPRSSPQTTKLDTWWVGPTEVLDRIGKESYIVQIKPERTFEVHTSHMKPYVKEILKEPTIQLFHYLPTHEEFDVTPHEWEVDKVIKHRIDKNGKFEFLTRWIGSSEETWEPIENFFMRYNSDLINYCKKCNLSIDLTNCLPVAE